MAKIQTRYVCSSCGAQAAQELGRCPVCGAWGTYVEETIQKGTPTRKAVVMSDNAPINIRDVQHAHLQRIDLHCEELNRVLGGGLVPGSMVLLGGEPGIGKSTLALQVVLNMGEQRTLYVSGEESVQQLRLRADRIASNAEQCQVVSETNLERILQHIEQTQPEIIVIDSIQTIQTEALEASAGSVSQVRECATRLLRCAKETNTPMIVIGHINKEGSIAGPKILEHIVDVVLQFEGDQHYMYRILRGQKNRFGSTSEIGIFEMMQNGLREVKNPSELLLTQAHQGLSGVAIASAIEGVRPLLIEVQALVSSAPYGIPQRSSTGFDTRRLNMLLAVLEKRVGFKLGAKDVFLNIAGGLRVTDPANDLAVIASVLSSSLDMPIDHQTCLTGEVGLSGEIRPVTRIEQRVLEAQKLGFKRIITPAFSAEGTRLTHARIQIIQVNKVEEAFRMLFSKTK
ncbi:MAG: DNA repair protein RadA [Paludibacteraceae bacterium]|nr:DNA repair protein RadA [Paludibacteraceae bacterium]